MVSRLISAGSVGVWYCGAFTKHAAIFTELATFLQQKLQRSEHRGAIQEGSTVALRHDGAKAAQHLVLYKRAALWHCSTMERRQHSIVVLYKRAALRHCGTMERRQHSIVVLYKRAALRHCGTTEQRQHSIVVLYKRAALRHCGTTEQRQHSIVVLYKRAALRHDGAKAAQHRGAIQEGSTAALQHDGAKAAHMATRFQAPLHRACDIHVLFDAYCTQRSIRLQYVYCK